MSRTDKTRPYWVQEKDPYNQRFRKIGGEWFYKPMFAKNQCWCCSQKLAFWFEDGRKRMQWRQERQKLIKEWRYE